MTAARAQLSVGQESRTVEWHLGRYAAPGPGTGRTAPCGRLFSRKRAV